MTSWTAQFIAPEQSLDAGPVFRKEFVLDTHHGAVAEATLDLSALGVCEAYLNGHPVSADVLTPGWTSYEWRIRHSTTDVTELLGEGISTLGLALGNGWYRGRLGWTGGSGYYGTDRAAFAELRIRFADGYEQVVATDESWRAASGDVISDDLYDGQAIDARRRLTGWKSTGYSGDGFSGVRAIDVDLALLEPYIGPPVRRQEEIAPERIWTSPSGRILVDFGQNLVGWIRIRVAGPEGSSITLRHAEVLENDELGVRPLRSAIATDRFTLSGDGVDEFEPTFTFHGFRYAEVDGWPGGIESLRDGDLTAVVVSSELRRIGHFATSNPKLNQLHKNVVWGMKGNFLDVPTDCPQRDERLGWTGDIAAFAPTAAYLFDVQAFLQDWLVDVAAEQAHHKGVVPYVVPDVLKYMETPTEFLPFASTAVWSDAAVWVPWALWQAYGDQSILSAAFDSMSLHVRTVRETLSPSGLWDTGFQFGDWLDPDAPADDPAAAKADTGVVATASAYRSANLVAQAAAILGKESEQAEFEQLASSIRASFNQAYVKNGRILSDCTTVYTLALAFDLLEAEDRLWAGDRLAELVQESDYRISTGFAGTPFITDALSSTGHLDEAYRLLLQEQNPSWLYPVTMGATTIWERWDSMLPDGSINPGEMTSFNHYALGAVADWMHRVVAGLSALEPGYRRVLVAPQPGGSLDWAETSLASPHGEISVRWETLESGIAVDVRLPPGVTGVLRLNGHDDLELEEGVHHIDR